MTLASLPPADSAALSPARLALEHQSRSFVTIPAPCLAPPALGSEIARLEAAHRGVVAVETIGQSVLGRDIRLLSIGRGATSILLWSQMHGDEPTATPALLDLADFLARNREQPDVARILDRFTLRMIPMLNPDGAALYERRNAQGIDINRDALMLATPEGRLLKAIRERFSPILGFNLHDQGRRTTVGSTGVLSSISLLAVAGDEAGTMTPGRLRAKKVASRIVKTLSPFIQGGIARYDEDWNPRAFGDNVTAWGSPVVLIESGGFPTNGGFRDLTRLNFIALVSTLDGLAQNDLADETADAYDTLLRNRSDAWADIAIAGASILEPVKGTWYEADVAFDILASDQALAGCAPARAASRVVEVGDSRVVTPGTRLIGSGWLLAAADRTKAMPAGVVTIEALRAAHPGLALPADDPKAVLRALALSPTAPRRGGSAIFLLWTGRRFVSIVDGAGLEALR